jgi:PAS domain S-box-containing protein
MSGGVKGCDRGMNASGFQSSRLRDCRLAPLATSALPAWLWSTDATRIVWANPVGAAMFGAPTSAALAARTFGTAEPAAAQIARLAATLSPGAAPRLERLRGLGAGIGSMLTCACSHIVLADTPAILVVAAERAGPNLPLGERVARLLAGSHELIAAFGTDGHLIAATDAARAHLHGATALAALGAQVLAADALASGHAAGTAAHGGQISIDRVGCGDATVLIANFAAPDAAGGSAAAAPSVSSTGASATAANDQSPRPGPATASEPAPASDQPPQCALRGRERRHPLRFVWQMDEAGRFTLGSDEFITLIGPRTAAANGRPWLEMAAELDLDPEGQVARSLATHDTWSGIIVCWPVDASFERLPIELSGLPVFDRDRIFRGYRGFGVCRDVARLAGLAQRRHSSPVAVQDLVPLHVMPSNPPPAAPSTDDAPRPAPATLARNIVPFPTAGAEPSGPALSPLERNAFRELSRKLTQRLTAGDIAREHKEENSTAADEEGDLAAAPPANSTSDVAATLALAQAELAELGSILDTATDGVVLLDRQRLVLSANRSAQALFGYDAHELIGHPFSELFAAESVEVASGYLDNVTRDDAASLLNSGREVIGLVRQGGVIPLFMTVGRIGSRADKLCVVFRDITQWKKAEYELTKAKRQAEKASSAKSDFLAKISHEIRTPLNAIIGFSEVMMEERFGPIGNERYREYIKDVHASGGHLLSLINDLLDLSKIEAGKLELTFTSVALNDITQQCVAIMQPQAGRERIIIRTSLPPALPQVVADARSVRQIVLNLLSNSIKFTGAGGQVIVSTALNDNGEVVLRVRDTGIGMSEKDLVTALEPFRQLTTSARRGGTGLGLPLTKALAEANRASFHIKSAPTAGTLVEIAFPASRVLAR